MGARTRKLFRTALMSGLEANGVKLSEQECLDKAYVLNDLFNFGMNFETMQLRAKQASQKLKKM